MRTLALLLALPVSAQLRPAAPRGGPVPAGPVALPPAAASSLKAPSLSASPAPLSSPLPKPEPIPAGAAYAQVLAERGWAEHRTADAAYLLVLRKGADAHGREVFVVDALDAADPARGPVAHVDFAVHAEEKQAVFDGPMDSWVGEAPVAPSGVAPGDLSHFKEHLWFGLSVVPEHRKRGLAGLLMDTASVLARKAGAERLVIYATEDSKGLYTRLYQGRVLNEDSWADREGDKVHRFEVALPEAPRPRDKTLRYLGVMNLLKKREAGPLPEGLRSSRVLIVPGMFGNHQPDAYQGNLRRMEELGVAGGILRINTEGRTEDGMQAIGRAVAESPEPVVLVGHSRGGVLVHDWYRTAPQALKDKVSRIVLIQAPLAGTRYAEWVGGSWLRRLVARVLGWKLGADLLRTAKRLTPPVRAAVLSALPPWTTEDLAKVLTLRSVKPPGPGFYGRYARLLKALGSPESDGIVPAESARVPGSADILLQDVDHSNTILQRPGAIKRLRGYRPHPSYDAGDVTEALLRILFR